MGRYAAEPDNATKAAKAKGSNLRVHFKVKNSFSYIINSKMFWNWFLFVLFDIVICDLKKGKIENAELKGGRFNKPIRNVPQTSLIMLSIAYFRTPVKRLKPSKRCPFTELPLTWRT